MTEIAARLTTALEDRYRIDRELGQRGMGPRISQMELMNTDTAR